MEKEAGNYSGNFPSLDYNPLEFQTHHQQDKMKSSSTSAPSDRHHNDQIVDYMLNNNNPPPPPLPPPNFYSSNSFDKLSFADVMQFADFGPKLALNQTKTAPHDQDDVYFLKFPVLNDHHNNNYHHHKLQDDYDDDDDGDDDRLLGVEHKTGDEEHRTGMFLGENVEKVRTDEANNNNNNNNKSNKRKRARSVKTSEEVESQRMTHIAVERNRRKQMNEHLRVLRSLMPSSYVQRGDQASIIGGAIEFVRELEQLLQCLESQKRRRLYGDAGQRPVGDPSSQQTPPLMFPPPMPMPINNNPNDNNIAEYETGLGREETAESKSCLADVEVKLLGFDALIKILSRRRPGQLIKTIAALEDMQLNILHTNITTIEQTVLYSFNVKIGGEARFSAEDMANSVQQILSFIHASTNM